MKYARLHLLTNDFDQRGILRITVGSVVERRVQARCEASLGTLGLATLCSR